MSSITRRQVLVSSAMVGLSAGMVATARANVAETFLQSCPHCSANLAMGDLHRADCEAARAAPPLDDEINPEAKKTAGKAYAQEPSGCGARGYDTKSGKPRKEEPGCGARGYDLKSGKQSR